MTEHSEGQIDKMPYIATDLNDDIFQIFDRHAKEEQTKLNNNANLLKEAKTTKNVIILRNKK